MELLNPDRPFVAIPVFPSRLVRHSSVYINANAGIASPRDLIGKRVGTPEYQMTAPVWIRGIMDEHYGVPVDGVSYVTGGEETPNRDEKLRLDLPPNIRIERIGNGQTLSRMLADGEIDALYTARKPSTYDGLNVRRLFPDFVPVEQRYWRETGIFPIMHVIAIRRDVYEANRWIAMELFKAFREAQKICYQGLGETNALKAMLPWLNAHVEQAIDLLGEDYWPYGVEANRKTLKTFLHYHRLGGLSSREISVDELFAPETLEEFVI